MRYLLSILFCFSFIWLSAQSKHFVYIQSESRQPFYIRMGDKIMSSTEYGYIIIPSLAEGNLSFVLGFPKNRWSSSRYNLEIGRKDLGYLLKQVDSSIWALYDLQDGSLLESSERYSYRKSGMVSASDSFTEVLAQVSNTPALNQYSTITDTIAQKQTISTIKPKLEVEKQSVEVKNQSQSAAPEIQAKVNQIMSASDPAGFSSIYHVASKAGDDTVVIFIPQDNPEPKSASVTQDPKNAVENSRIKITADSGLTVNNRKTEFVDSVRSDSIQVPESQVCAKKAEEKDFLQLRKSMVMRDTEESMLEEAEKGMAKVCFSTEQIRNLSVLFLSESNKLIFMKISYAHVFDRDNFPKLKGCFSELKYQQEFEVLIH